METNKDLITENKSNFQLNIKYPWSLWLFIAPTNFLSFNVL